MGVNKVTNTLSPFWIYVCGNINGSSLVLSNFEHCGCLPQKCMYLFHSINEYAVHKTEIIYPLGNNIEELVFE